MGATQEVLQTLNDSGMGISKQAIGIASTGIGLGVAVIRSVHMVPEGHVGVRTRFGKAKRPDTKLATKFGHKADDLYGLGEKGFMFKLPGMESIIDVSIRDNFSELEPAMFDVKDGDEEKQILALSSVTWAIKYGQNDENQAKEVDGAQTQEPYTQNTGNDEQYRDNPYRSLYKVNNGVIKVKKKHMEKIEHELEQAVKKICGNGLRRAMTGNKIPKTDEEYEALFHRLKSFSEDRLMKYGVEVLELDLLTASNSLGQMVRETGQGDSRAIASAIALAEEGQEFEIGHAEAAREIPTLHVAQPGEG